MLEEGGGVRNGGVSKQLIYLEKLGQRENWRIKELVEGAGQVNPPHTVGGPEGGGF